ncbi:hypothetical protein HYPSUDRAFT_45202 [Hypholoma sublateritium FD-334 SS-4]|uniref:Peptidase C14 caspase domain-containing protein n=1 Tax=Hypholoma sublateritium (strain FD-334 SS-4) TaxID=945553 RepID=A0A0D2PE54_HYPSF|nr:hypothetical protein HYPSUDRAFT_45202 [Hypholoma sublateritium FD-334 SS-4]
MSTGPLIIALARVSCRGAIPARISLAAYLHLIIKPPTFAPLCKLLKMHALWLARQPSSRLRKLLKIFKELLYGKRKALLIGIQNQPEEPIEECSPAASAIVSVIESPIKSKPRAPRRKNRKTKKSKGASRSQETDALKGPHHDVQAMYDLLINKYGYYAEDIVVLIDDGDPQHRQPTRENIIYHMKYLVSGAREGDRLFFHYAGHADQEDTTDIEEEDGKNEFILTSDGFKIMDNELKLELVESLCDIKCTLTAVLDCCHSGSLLDLEHSHCNNVYVPWLNKGRRRTKTLQANARRDGDMIPPMDSIFDTAGLTPANMSPPKPPTQIIKQKPASLIINTAVCYPTPPPSHQSRKPSYEGPGINITDATPPAELIEFMSPQHFTMSPSAVFPFCTGDSRQDILKSIARDTLRTGVKVVCISAAKDSELAWEDGEGKSMTQYFVQNLTINPRPTLHTLLTSISHDIHAYYVSELHQQARYYKKKLESLGKREGDLTASVAEMHNFQNPQVCTGFDLVWQLKWSSF